MASRGNWIRSSSSAVWVVWPGLEHHGVHVPAEASSIGSSSRSRAGPRCWPLAHGQELLGLLAVRDAMRPDAAEALAQLRSDGLALAVLSGDREGPVRQLGQQLSLQPDQLAWGLRPEHKLQRLHQALGLVAMVVMASTTPAPGGG